MLNIHVDMPSIVRWEVNNQIEKSRIVFEKII